MSFRGQNIGVPLLFAAAVLIGALGAFALTGGGAPAAPAAAGPVTTPAVPPPSSPTTSAAPRRPAAGSKAAKSGPRYLCIYPGAGARHVVSALPGGVAHANWTLTCRATDGNPAARVSASRFEDLRTHQFFKLQQAVGGNFYVRLIAGS
jgi:hypothetical protein